MLIIKLITLAKCKLEFILLSVKKSLSSTLFCFDKFIRLFLKNIINIQNAFVYQIKATWCDKHVKNKKKYIIYIKKTFVNQVKDMWCDNQSINQSIIFFGILFFFLLFAKSKPCCVTNTQEGMNE